MFFNLKLLNGIRTIFSLPTRTSSRINYIKLALLLCLILFLVTSGCAPPNIEKLKSNDDINGLIKAMGHKDETIREEAIEALSVMGDKVVEPLIKALNRRNNDIKRGSIEALVNIGDQRAVEPIASLLNERFVESNAARALGTFEDSRAVEPLLKAIEDDEKTGWFYKDAIQSLVKIGDSQAIDPLIDLARIRGGHELAGIIIPEAINDLAIISAEDNFFNIAQKVLNEAFDNPVTDGEIKAPVFFMMQNNYEVVEGKLKRNDFTANRWTIYFPTRDSFLRENDYIQANQISDVQTVVAIRERTKFAGKYGNFITDGYDRIWEVRLVSWPDGKVLVKEEFIKEAPSIIGQTSGGVIIGSRPAKELIEWVISLLGNGVGGM